MRIARLAAAVASQLWLLALPAVGEQAATSSLRSESEIVQADVRSLVEATYRGDVDTVLSLTHPVVVAGLGGEATARVALSKGMERFAYLEMKLESFSFPSPPTFLEGTQHRFAIVPTLSVIDSKGRRVESLNFQLGVRAKNSKRWTYVEGSRVNRANALTLFPDFPPDYAFPEFYRRPL